MTRCQVMLLFIVVAVLQCTTGNPLTALLGDSSEHSELSSEMGNSEISNGEIEIGSEEDANSLDVGEEVDDVDTSTGEDTGDNNDLECTELRVTDSVGGTIFKVDLATLEVENLDINLQAAVGIDIDSDLRRMFFVGMNGTRFFVSHADVDGTDIQILYEAVPTAVLTGIAADTSIKRLFVIDGNSELFISIDYSVLNTPVVTMVAVSVARGAVFGIEVDPANQMIYWVDRTFDFIARAKYDGSSAQIIIITQFDVFELALDVTGSRLFYGHGNDIEVANLDGSSNQVLTTTGTEEIFEIELVNGSLFLTHRDEGDVRRVALETGPGGFSEMAFGIGQFIQPAYIAAFCP